MKAVLTNTERLIEGLYSQKEFIGESGKLFTTYSGMSTPSNLRTIERLMLLHSFERTLEVGLACGASCVVFTTLHRQLHPYGPRRHVAIDPYQKTVWDNVARLKLNEAGLSDQVEILEQRSSIALPRLLAEGQTFGMIYIDGSHLIEDVFVDAYFSTRLVDHGGYLLFDDASDPHVRKVLTFLDSSIPGLKRQPEQTLKQVIAKQLGKRQLAVYRRVGDVEREWNSPFRQF